MESQIGHVQFAHDVKSEAFPGFQARLVILHGGHMLQPGRLEFGFAGRRRPVQSGVRVVGAYLEGDLGVVGDRCRVAGANWDLRVAADRCRVVASILFFLS